MIRDDGYHQVRLRKSNKATRPLTHRLVAAAFIPNPENKPTVNHINGNKADNRVNNLEWATNQENSTHAVKFGLIDTKGEKHHNAKLTESDVKLIFELRNKGLTQKEIAEIISKVSRGAIKDVLIGRSWKHINT